MSSDCDAQTPGLPVRRVAEVVPKSEDQRWLVRSLWLRSAVGVLGGLPKCYKTWLAIELSWAVASGKKALDRFEVEDGGSVLVFLAEDDPPNMRARFDAVASARGTELTELPLFFIDIGSLLLDDPHQLDALRRTVEHHRPKLLVLDPFIRLVRRVDENSAGDVSAVLGELRRLQRDFSVAVVLVHHMRKARSAHPGQQLRGSGDFAAWCDSAIYLTRRDDQRLVTVEHRSAAPPDPFRLHLVERPLPHLEVVGPEAPPAPSLTATSLEGAILDLLRLESPRSTVTIRDVLRVRKATVVQALHALTERGLLVRLEHGWALTTRADRPT